MSWQSEFSSALKSTDDLKNFFGIDFPTVTYPLFVPKILAANIKEKGINSPLGLQFLPHANEDNIKSGLYDPIGDITHSKGNQLIHRYQNRVLFTPTTVCPVLCRYCFRKNELSQKDEVFNQNYKAALEYLKMHSEVNEVIFTGGDPLILSNEKLEQYFEDLSSIKHISYVRLHSRTPVILPSRIDEDFLKVMSRSKKLFKRALLMIHINHSDELYPEVKMAFNRLNDSGIEVYAQTVLLKGINDNTETLAKLFMDLADLKVSPYYLHHPDETLGAMHFYLSLEEGRRIVHPLHNLLPGWALPKYVFDIPGGEGKIEALNPETFNFSGTLLNRHGKEINLRTR